MGNSNYGFFDLTAITYGQVNRGKEMKVFDWDKAAKLIRERKPKIAEAGLENDWAYTGGVIFEDGKPVTDSNTFLSSTWATPILELDGEEIECYVMESKTTFNEDTKWPDSALKILNDTGNY